MKLLSLMLFVSAALAQDAPKPPACLSGPVTQGSVTITCSLIDNTAANASADNGIAIAPNGGFIFQVRVVSTDPAVVAARIGVSYVSVGAPQGTPPSTQWGLTGITVADPTTTTTPGFRYTFYLQGSVVTSIQVQELKPSTSQTF
jgi:hypothetical protein